MALLFILVFFSVGPPLKFCDHSADHRLVKALSGAVNQEIPDTVVIFQVQFKQDIRHSFLLPIRTAGSIGQEQVLAVVPEQVAHMAAGIVAMTQDVLVRLEKGGNKLYPCERVCNRGPDILQQQRKIPCIFGSFPPVNEPEGAFQSGQFALESSDLLLLFCYRAIRFSFLGLCHGGTLREILRHLFDLLFSLLIAHFFSTSHVLKRHSRAIFGEITVFVNQGERPRRGPIVLKKACLSFRGV